MIVRIPILHVHHYWPLLEKAAMVAVPPFVSDVESRLFNILLSLQEGNLQGFVLGALDEDGNPALAAVFMTEIMVDGISKTRNLGLYSMYGFSELPLPCWFELRDFLLRYARDLGCSKVCAYTNNEGIIKFCERFGGAVEYRFVTFDVTEKEVKPNVVVQQEEMVGV
jgi:hypothetical protein